MIDMVELIAKDASPNISTFIDKGNAISGFDGIG